MGLKMKTKIKLRYCMKCGDSFAPKGFATHRKYCTGKLDEPMPVPDYGDKGKHVFPVKLQTNALPKSSPIKIRAYLQLIGDMTVINTMDDLGIDSNIKDIVHKLRKYLAETE